MSFCIGLFNLFLIVPFLCICDWEFFYFMYIFIHVCVCSSFIILLPSLLTPLLSFPFLSLSYLSSSLTLSPILSHSHSFSSPLSPSSQTRRLPSVFSLNDRKSNRRSRERRWTTGLEKGQLPISFNRNPLTVDDTSTVSLSQVSLSSSRGRENIWEMQKLEREQKKKKREKWKRWREKSTIILNENPTILPKLVNVFSQEATSPNTTSVASLTSWGSSTSDLENGLSEFQGLRSPTPTPDHFSQQDVLQVCNACILSNIK